MNRRLAFAAAAVALMCVAGCGESSGCPRHVGGSVAPDAAVTLYGLPELLGARLASVATECIDLRSDSGRTRRSVRRSELHTSVEIIDSTITLSDSSLLDWYRASGVNADSALRLVKLRRSLKPADMYERIRANGVSEAGASILTARAANIRMPEGVRLDSTTHKAVEFDALSAGGVVLASTTAEVQLDPARRSMQASATIPDLAPELAARIASVRAGWTR